MSWGKQSVVLRYLELASFAGLTPAIRSDVSRLYDSTNTVRENMSSVNSLRVGGDTQLRGPGMAPIRVEELSRSWYYGRLINWVLPALQTGFLCQQGDAID